MILTIKSNDTTSNASDSTTNNEEDKLTRLSSCIKLSNIMINENNNFLLSTTKSFFPETHKEMSFDNLYESLRIRILITCYKQISLLKAAELTNLNVKLINPFKIEYKNLLSYESFKTIYSDVNEKEKMIYDKDKDVNINKNEDDNLKFLIDTENLEKLLSKIQSDKGLNTYEEKIASFVDFISNKEQKLNSQYISKSRHIPNDQENKNSNKGQNFGDDDSYLDEMEYSNLNFDFFGVDLMSPKVTNTVGLFLLGLVLYGIYVSYALVVKTPQISNKKKKKEKKN